MTLATSTKILFSSIIISSVFGCFQSQAIGIGLTPLGTYSTGPFDQSAAEIPAYDPENYRLFITNSAQNAVNILNISDPTNPTLFGSINLGVGSGGVNSVAVFNGVVAVAEQGAMVGDRGKVWFYDTSGNPIMTGGSNGNDVEVGFLPDSLIFTPYGTKVLVANEGEPSDDYTVDPEGSISIIDVSTFGVMTADFTGFNGQEAALNAAGVRIFGPGATVAQDLEPEYIAATNDTAWVSLQENNAFAIVDIATATVTSLVPLGFKNHSLAGNGLDPSNLDNGINIGLHPVFGMYQPDTIAAYTVDGETYIVTANEGDSRDYGGFSEEARVADLTLDGAFAGDTKNEDELGRLKVTTTLGNAGDGDNSDYEELYAFGGRSFSIRDANGNLVWDSGDDFEQKLALLLPGNFNSDNDEATFDSRSDDKGPEPEALTIGKIGDRFYAFIGLERVGGIMVYDITNPNSPSFLTYFNNRNFDDDVPVQSSPGVSNPLALDSGPEGMLFISPQDSPTGSRLLVVANEVSGTTTIYDVSTVPEPGTILGLMMLGLIGGVKALKSK